MSLPPGASAGPTPPTARRPVWLDTDPGFDDWLTMLMLAADPAIDWLGASVVAGNAPLATTLRNALAIADLHGLRVPIHAGCDRPWRGPPATAQNVLGADGLRSTGAPLPPPTRAADGHDGPGALTDAALASPVPMTLVAIGPLTNVATALRRTPALAGRIGEIVLMGGSTDRGNHTPAAEFNFFADPEAAAFVFESGVPIRMFGLNLCRQVLLTQAHVDLARGWAARERQARAPEARATATPAPAEVLAGHLDAYQRIRSADGSEPMPLYDPVVAAWLAEPGLFTFEPARVDIECAGRFTRGMSVCDFKRRDGRAANARVAVDADGPGTVARVLRQLRAALDRPGAAAGAG